MPNLANYNLAIVVSEVRRGNQISAVNRDLALLKNQAGRTAEGMATAAAAQTKMSKAMLVAGRVMRNILLPGLLLGTAAFAKFTIDGVKAFAKFDEAMRNTFTLLPGISEEAMGSMSDDVRDLSIEYGRMTNEVAPALYKALSMGVPEDNVMAAVELASMAATAGVADLSDTMATGQGVVNAYGGEMYDLAEVYDILFVMVREGGLSINDLNSVFSDVTSVAAETRTPLEGIAAALSVMRRQGDSAGEAADLLRILLMQLGTDGTSAFKAFEKAAGESYRTFIQGGGTLVDAMVILDEYAKRTGESIGSIIAGDSPFYRDTQAARASIELTDIHLQSLIDTAEEFDDVAGTMGQAFLTQSEGIQFQMNQLRSAWEDFKLEIGDWAINEGIFGVTAPSLIENATNVAKAQSGYYQRRTDEMIEARYEDTQSLEEWLGVYREIYGLFELDTQNYLGNQESYQVTLRKSTIEMAAAVDTKEDYIELLKEEGIYYDLTNKHVGQGIGSHEQLIDALWEEGEALAYQRKIYDGLEWAGKKYARDVDNRIDQNERQLQWMNLVNDFDWQENASFIPPETKFATTEIDDYFASIEDGAMTAIKVIDEFAPKWEHLSEIELAHYDVVKDIASELWDAYDDYLTAEGEYVDILIDNATKVSEVSEQLAADLTDDQRHGFEDILDNVEEGGAEWMAAWEALQGDLTKTQRQELVAQLSDMETAHGTIQSIFTGDAENAEEAELRIVEALNAMALAYNAFTLDTVENELFRIFGEGNEDNPQIVRNMIALGLAVGDLEQPEADFLNDEITKMGKVKDVTTRLTQVYSEGDGIITPEEAAWIVQAADLARTHFEQLTTEGVIALLEKSTGQEGLIKIGVPFRAPGGVQDETKKSQKQLDQLVSRGPYLPEIGADKREFDTIVDSVWTSITMLEEGVHYIDFAARYDDSALPDGGTDDSGHAGMDKIIPAGFPNDSYTIGVESGERVIVMTEAQQRASANIHGGGQNYDQRDQRVTIHNYTAAAAAITNAYLDVKHNERINEWMGG